MRCTTVPVIDRLVEERQLDHGVDQYELLELRRENRELTYLLEQHECGDDL